MCLWFICIHFFRYIVSIVLCFFLLVLHVLCVFLYYPTTGAAAHCL